MNQEVNSRLSASQPVGQPASRPVAGGHPMLSPQSSALSPLFSVIIVSLNGGAVIGRALDSLRADDYPNVEIIVVDNGSSDDLARVVRGGYPEARLIQSPVNLGFAGGNNLAMREAGGDFLVLLNDDTEVRPGWLGALARAARENPRAGVLGCKLLYPDGKTVQHAGGTIKPNGSTHHVGYEKPDDGSFDQTMACDYVTGAAFAIRREVLDKIGPLDEKYFPIYFEEVDYCWRARRAGYQVLYVPGSVVVHHESRTQARYSFRFIHRYNCGRLRFVIKCFSWRQILAALWYEMRWWTWRYSYECYLPVLWAYWKTIFRLPSHLAARAEYQRTMRGLTQL
jgi:GT2 family glycosyltransferase